MAREAEELLMHHTITYPRPEADLLLAIRKGKLPYKQVAEMLEAGLDRLEECHRQSVLPDRGDHAAAEALVLEVYRQQVTADNPSLSPVRDPSTPTPCPSKEPTSRR